MISIFYDIIAGNEVYYIADEVEVEKGIKTLYRLTGQIRTRKEAEARLKEILKQKGGEKRVGN